jgi:peptidoglycan hydrolase-like protein with peptidoglycan-binding domain
MTALPIVSRRAVLMICTLAIFAGSCTEEPKPQNVNIGTTTPAPIPSVLHPQAATQLSDPEAVAAAGRDLRMLGYLAGKVADQNDPSFQRAVRAFEKDAGLADDGILTADIAERLIHLRIQIPRTEPVGQGLFVYSDGAQRGQALGLVIPTPPGLSSDLQNNFMRILAKMDELRCPPL